VLSNLQDDFEPCWRWL